MISKKSEKLFALTLVKKGWFTPEQLKAVIAQKGTRALDQFLHEKGVLSAKDLERIWEEVQHQKKCFGAYEIQEKLAKGAMGEVYKVKHLHLHQIYAMKVMLLHQNHSEEMVARFQQEAQIIAKLQHPYIIRVVDSGKIKNRSYLCMEYIEGATLETWIQKKHLLRKGIELFCKILEGLDYAHHQGVIHRDLKPENIFVTPEDIPKIGDFGLSKFREVSKNMPQTVAGEFLGTPAYMAPEQAVGESDPRSDIYSITVCLYRFLTLRCPFESESLQKLFYLLITEDPLPPSKLNSEVTKDLEAIVLKGLQKRKEKRYQSAKMFARDLKRFLEGEPVLARATPFWERSLKWSKRHRKQFIFFSLCLGIILSVFSYAGWQQHQQKKQQIQNLFSAYQKKKQQAENSWNAPNQEKTFLHFLETLDQIQLLLNQDPKNSLWLQDKTNISEQLVRLACFYNEYALASYLASNLNSVGITKNEPTFALKQYIQREQSKQLKQHQQRFHFWKERLTRGKLQEHEREQAIFEIAKMEEPEILEELLAILQESISYFSNSSRQNSSLDEFYQTMVLILGHLEKEKTATYIYEVLQQIFFRIDPLPPNRRSLADIEYMVCLAQALSYTKASGFAKKLENMRMSIGQSSLFWKRTTLASRILFKIDGILQSQEKISPQVALENANLKYLQGDWQGAFADFQKLLTIPDCSAQAYNGLGLTRIELKEHEQAILDFNKAIQLSPESEFYNNRGFAWHHLRNYEEAIKDYTTALKLNSESVDAYLNRAVARKRLGDFEGADRDLSMALKKNPRFGNAYLNRALLRKDQGDFAGAIQDFNQAIQLDPKAEEVYFQRGIVKKHQKDYHGALADQTKAIQLNSGYAKAYIDRGNVKMILGDSEGAMQDYNEGIRVAPDMALGYHDRAMAKRGQGDVEGALKDLKEAIRFNPKMVAAYNNRGTIWYELKKYAEAIEDYSFVLQKDPNQLQACYNRGLAYYQLGKHSESKRDFLNFLQRLPRNSLNDQAREYIFTLFPELKRMLEEAQQSEKKK